MAQVYFDDVSEGQEIPKLVQGCDSQRLVLWAAGSGDYYQIHYDKDFAQKTGLPDRITHGALKHALLGRLLDEWSGDEGRVRRVACSYRGMDMIDRDVTCRGVITGKRQENGVNVVDLEVWTEDPDGNKTTPGTAVVELPAK
ncbi:MAG TPA: MaoC/PaaZ C-terminal domain-containing protein [Dehalococcoidia bacterium]